MQSGTTELGKMLLIIGVVFLIGGALLVSGAKLPFRLGRLPGDIVYKGPNGSLYFPIVTCVAISLALTLVSWIISLFRR